MALPQLVLPCNIIVIGYGKKSALKTLISKQIDTSSFLSGCLSLPILCMLAICYRIKSYLLIFLCVLQLNLQEIMKSSMVHLLVESSQSMIWDFSLWTVLTNLNTIIRWLVLRSHLKPRPIPPCFCYNLQEKIYSRPCDVSHYSRIFVRVHCTVIIKRCYEQSVL